MYFVIESVSHCFKQKFGMAMYVYHHILSTDIAAHIRLRLSLKSLYTEKQDARMRWTRFCDQYISIYIYVYIYRKTRDPRRKRECHNRLAGVYDTGCKNTYMFAMPSQPKKVWISKGFKVYFPRHETCVCCEFSKRLCELRIEFVLFYDKYDYFKIIGVNWTTIIIYII